MDEFQANEDCRIEPLVAAISGRWKLLVIYWLSQGTCRFNQLQRSLGTITHRTLARQLSELQEAGFVDRKDFKTLAHEMVHIWQHQNGGTDYMSEALMSQYFGAGYDLGKGLREGKSWSQLEPEQQGELVEWLAHAGWFDRVPSHEQLFIGSETVTFTREQFEEVRDALHNGKGAP